MNKTKSLNAKLIEGLKSCDKFGHPITLKYRNKAQFRSVLGGLITIGVSIFIMIYFFVQLKEVLNRESF
jgi:hypothetical protein